MKWQMRSHLEDRRRDETSVLAPCLDDTLIREVPEILQYIT